MRHARRPASVPVKLFLPSHSSLSAVSCPKPSMEPLAPVLYRFTAATREPTQVTPFQEVALGALQTSPVQLMPSAQGVCEPVMGCLKGPPQAW